MKDLFADLLGCICLFGIGYGSLFLPMLYK